MCLYVPPSPFPQTMIVLGHDAFAHPSLPPHTCQVVFAFYGGGIKFGQNNDYEEQLRCNYDMTPVIISLDAGNANIY